MPFGSRTPATPVDDIITKYKDGAMWLPLVATASPSYTYTIVLPVGRKLSRPRQAKVRDDPPLNRRLSVNRLSQVLLDLEVIALPLGVLPVFLSFMLSPLFGVIRPGLAAPPKRSIDADRG